jgi:hypothetical protein
MPPDMPLNTQFQAMFSLAETAALPLRPQSKFQATLAQQSPP